MPPPFLLYMHRIDANICSKVLTIQYVLYRKYALVFLFKIIVYFLTILYYLLCLVQTHSSFFELLEFVVETLLLQFGLLHESGHVISCRSSTLQLLTTTLKQHEFHANKHVNKKKKQHMLTNKRTNTCSLSLHS